MELPASVTVHIRLRENCGRQLWQDDRASRSEGPIGLPGFVGEKMLQGTGLQQPYGAKEAICQDAAGVPGLPWLVIVAPFISQT